MNHIRIFFPVSTTDTRDTLSALLSTLAITGIEETDEGLVTYIGEDGYDEAAIREIADQLRLSFQTETVEQKNWNEEWEKNFEPVIIDGFCSVRADFHLMPAGVLYDIVITPKMSFGTGHHATTALMMTLMRDIAFESTQVYDFGTGTGILAILAEKLGASSVLAVDNDAWAYENAVENCSRNGTTKVTVAQATADDVAAGTQFDVILANINRHILLDYMQQMATLLKPGGTLLLSGILTEDTAIIKAAAQAAGFAFRQETSRNNWACQLYRKD